jgi:hypothetical protein
MERLFSAFVRVLRNLDDADGLLVIFQEFESNPSALSAEDRIRLLDFPDLATQVANIIAAAPATLNKQDLLKKAAESPGDLTSSEIDLLQNRYWGKRTFDEKDAFEDALCDLADVSYEHRTETLQRLRDFQSHLYELYEAKAIANASDEANRFQEMVEAGEQKQLEIMLRHEHPWLRQLWQEDQGKKPWGYAIFVNPHWEAENPDRSESYDLKSTHSIHMAFSAIASGLTIQSRYTIEPLDWPSGTPTEDEKLSCHPARITEAV